MAKIEATDLPVYKPKMSFWLWTIELLVIVAIVVGIVGCFVKWHLRLKQRERKMSKVEEIRCDYCMF